MSKRKILSLALTLCMVAILAVGGTLAYFTDTDSKTNTFTVGNVDITLNDVFPDGKLQPGKKLNKDVSITLENGSEDAYVWYTYTIPEALDNVDASKNIIHVNHEGMNWDDWYTKEPYASREGAHGDFNKTWDVDWTREVEDGIVTYTALYHGKLTAGETTTIGLTQVYMDTHVNKVNDDWVWEEDGKQTTINYDLDNGLDIVVTAYAIQAEGFADVYAAYAAYNAQK